MCVQYYYFSDEIEAWQSGSNRGVKKTSPLYKFDPVLIDDVLHVGCRLERADI